MCVIQVGVRTKLAYEIEELFAKQVFRSLGMPKSPVRRRVLSVGANI